MTVTITKIGSTDLTVQSRAGPIAVSVAIQGGTQITVAGGPPGPAGATGPAGPPGASGAGYTHTQLSPALTWTINHNLGYRPSVDVFNAGGLSVIAEIAHLSTSSCEVRFSNSQAGFARLN